MKLQTKPKVKITKDLLYNGDFSDIVTIKENKHRTFVNAISATRNLKHAALELGVSHMTVLQWCTHKKIDKKQQDIMRGYFNSLKKKIKYKYNRHNYEPIEPRSGTH